jgi:hypothetical protein
MYEHPRTVVDALGTPSFEPLRFLSYIYLSVLVKSEVMFAGFQLLPFV